MRSWSIPVGRLFGIEVRIHLTFLFLLVFVWSTEASTQDASAAMRGLGLVGIVFGSVVLHELGHALVARGVVHCAGPEEGGAAFDQFLEEGDGRAVAFAGLLRAADDAAADSEFLE